MNDIHIPKFELGHRYLVTEGTATELLDLVVQEMAASRLFFRFGSTWYETDQLNIIEELQLPTIPGETAVNPADKSVVATQ